MIEIYCITGIVITLIKCYFMYKYINDDGKIKNTIGKVNYDVHFNLNPNRSNPYEEYANVIVFNDKTINTWSRIWTMWLFVGLFTSYWFLCLILFTLPFLPFLPFLFSVIDGSKLKDYILIEMFIQFVLMFLFAYEVFC